MAQGVKVDMTTGSLWDKIILFAIPVALMAFLQQLFNATDVAVIGQFAGTKAMAAVGSCGAMCSFVVSLGTGMSLGANVTIATNIGAGDKEAVRRAVHTAMLVAVGGGALLAVVGQAIIGPIMACMGIKDPAVEAMALTYMRIYLAGLPVIFLYDFQAAIMRSQGDTKTPLIALTVSGAVNVALNLLFVCVLGMDVDGVAIATVTSSAISSVILLCILTHGASIVRVDLRALRIDGPSLKRIVMVGLPAGLQGALFSVANVIIQTAVNSLDTAVMAGNSAANNIDAFSWYSLNAFGQACTTFVGQNNGAGKQDRCHKTLKLCFIEGYTAYAVITTILLLFTTQLLSIFNSDPAVIEAGRIRVYFILATHLFTMVVEIVSGYLRGYGVSLPPTIVALFSICVLRVLWVLFVFPADHSLQTLLTVYPVSVGVNAVLTVILTFAMRKHLGRKTGPAHEAAAA